MPKHAHPANPLALAVLALLFERPMHPYEMAATLKQRHKEDSIKLRYGSLYTVIDLLIDRGFITPRETSRSGKRPERTTYELTGPGYDELRSWMRDLLRKPVNEYPQFTAGLSLLPVLPPEEAVALLRERTIHLSGEAARLESHLAVLANQEVPLPPHEMPPVLVGKKFPPLFVVEADYKLALIRAELAFVAELVRRVTEENWGPVDLWRELQAASARQHETEPSVSTREAPM